MHCLTGVLKRCREGATLTFAFMHHPYLVCIVSGMPPLHLFIFLYIYIYIYIYIGQRPPYNKLNICVLFARSVKSETFFT